MTLLVRPELSVLCGTHPDFQFESGVICYSPSPPQMLSSHMDLWHEIVAAVAAILVSAGVLLGGIRWAVSGALIPLRADMSALRNEMSSLRDKVHEDLRGTGERLARVEATITATEHRLNRIELHGPIHD